MDEIHVHKTKKSICANFAESPCTAHQAVCNIIKTTKTKVNMQIK